jgi:hypothetical protein
MKNGRKKVRVRNGNTPKPGAMVGLTSSLCTQNGQSPVPVGSQISRARGFAVPAVVLVELAKRGQQGRYGVSRGDGQPGRTLRFPPRATSHRFFTSRPGQAVRPIVAGLTLPSGRE